MVQTEKLIALVTHSWLQLWEALSAYTWMLLNYAHKQLLLPGWTTTFFFCGRNLISVSHLFTNEMKNFHQHSWKICSDGILVTALRPEETSRSSGQPFLSCALKFHPENSCSELSILSDWLVKVELPERYWNLIWRHREMKNPLLLLADQ